MKRSPGKVAARLVELALEQGVCVVDSIGFDVVDEGLTLHCAISRGALAVEQKPTILLQFDLSRDRSEVEFRRITEKLVNQCCQQLAELAGVESRH